MNQNIFCEEEPVIFDLSIEHDSYGEYGSRMKTPREKINWKPVKIKPKIRSPKARRVTGSPLGDNGMDLSLIVKEEDDSNNSNAMETNMAMNGRPMPFLEYGSQSPSGDDVKYNNGKWPKSAKTYNPKWETDPILKTWITRHPHDTGKVICRFCHSVIRAHKNDLLEHTRTLKHQRNFQQNTNPEEFNLFVMELNGLRKESPISTPTTTPTVAKKRSTGNKSNSNASVKSEFPISGSGPVTPNLNHDNNNSTNGNSGMSPSIDGTDATMYHSGVEELTSNGFSDDIDPRSLTDDLHDWQTDLHTPRDYLKVILEESSSATPPDCDWIPDPEDSPSKCSNLLSHLGNGHNGEEDYLIEDDSNLITEPGKTENDSQLPEALDFTNGLQPATNSTHVSSPSPPQENNQPMYNVQDIITGLQNGRFNIMDMCSLMKSTATAIEELHRSADQHYVIPASSTSTDNTTHIQTDCRKKREKSAKVKRKKSKKRKSSVHNEDDVRFSCS